MTTDSLLLGIWPVVEGGTEAVDNVINSGGTAGVKSFGRTVVLSNSLAFWTLFSTELTTVWRLEMFDKVVRNWELHRSDKLDRRLLTFWLSSCSCDTLPCRATTSCLTQSIITVEFWDAVNKVLFKFFTFCECSTKLSFNFANSTLIFITSVGLTEVCDVPAPFFRSMSFSWKN